MDTVHPLRTLLQLQLASDSNAVLHLPYILSTLDATTLQPSSHTQKWTSRLGSLIHSKDVGARWAGLCIAQRTAVLSNPLMLECAPGWVTVVLPMLSVRMSRYCLSSTKLTSFTFGVIRKTRVFLFLKLQLGFFEPFSQAQQKYPNSSVRFLLRTFPSSVLPWWSWQRNMKTRN